MKKKLNNYHKFFLYTIFLFIILFSFKLTTEQVKTIKKVTKESDVTKSTIKINEKNMNILVKYPKFRNKYLKEIVNSNIYKYVSNFKKIGSKYPEIDKILKMDYDITYFNNYLIIYYKIYNNLNKKEISNNLIIDTNKNKKVNINEIIKNEEIFKSITTKMFLSKYPYFVTDIVNNLDIKKYTYSFSTENLKIEVNNLNTITNISYVPNIIINLNSIKKYLNSNIVLSKVYKEEEKFDKYIALTFDDGPNSNTNIVLDTFISNNSHATFFVQGYMLKYYKETILRSVVNGNEIGNHTYNHRNLAKLSRSQVETQINSTNIIFNEITGKNMSLLRPPYGAIRKNDRDSLPYKIITWNIDTKDWLHRDSVYVSNYVLENAKDGAIILMHDIHKTSADAVKIIVPELISNGYKLVTVSELANIKGINLEDGKIYKGF